MNHGPDPQLCTMSDAEEGFRNTLREVFGDVEWDVSEVCVGYLYAKTQNEAVVVKRLQRKVRGAAVAYTVAIGEIETTHSDLRTAATLAKGVISHAVRALESVGMECEP